MRIHRLCLQNWGQHTTLEIELPPAGVISLTGPNNSGKSTLLSAIGWVLSPNSRNRYGDRNDIQDGQTAAAVTLEFTLEDNFHEPRRHLLRKEISLSEDGGQKSNPETKIELDGEILTGPQWEEFLNAKAGLQESSQFLSLMIAPQEEIHALLRAPLGTRNKDLRESLGISLPDFWNETLKEEVTNWAQKYAQRAGAIERALADSDIRLQELHSAQESYNLKLTELPQPETLAEQIAEIDKSIGQLKVYQDKQFEVSQLTRELEEAQTRKRAVRSQTYPALPPEADYSDLDLPQSKQRLRLLALAECQQRANTTEARLQQAEANADPTWPKSIEEKQALRTAIETEQQRLDKWIIEQEFIQQQIQRLQTQINRQYSPLENEAEPLDAFYQAANYHTSQRERLPLRKITLRDLKANYEHELATATRALNQLIAERQTLINQQELDPFTGTEAAQTLLKIWKNRTPQQRCILTGSDLSHLKEELVTQKAESFRALPLVTGSALLTVSSQQDTHLAALARLNQLNEDRTTLQNAIIEKKAALEPLIQSLDSLPSDKWLKISLDAIGACLTQIKQNLECRRQIQHYQAEASQPITSLEKEKNKQSDLKQQKTALEDAIQLQASLAEIQKELTTKLQVAQSNNTKGAYNTDTAALPEYTRSAEFTKLLGLSSTQLSEQIETLDRIIRSEEETREKTGAWERNIESIKENLRRAQTALATLKSSLESANIDLQEPVKLEQQKAAALEKLKTIQQLQALKAETEQHLRKTLDSREQLHIEEQQIQAEKQDLQAAKDAADFFAPRRAPKQLLRAALQEIVEETNRILPETGLEMELSVSPEMDFQVSFERAEKRITEPARRLGCGLATLVGMCLKMALARILQPNLKFLAFDEPSAQLDPAKKQAFSLFLKSLSRQALTGNQILVIEHDLAIAESCDLQIRLA